MDYVTIASTGNATDFGDLTAEAQTPASCSNAASAVQATPTSSAMALFAGGQTTYPNYLASVEYVNIATTGDAYLFGNLTQPTLQFAAVSSDTRSVFGGGLSTGDVRINVLNYLSYFV